VREKTWEELAAENAVLRQKLEQHERDGQPAATIPLEDRVLRAVLDQVPDYITVIDSEGRIVSVNRLITGQAPDVIVGRSAYDFVPAAAQASMRACFDRVFATGQSDELEIESVLSDGRRLPMWTRVGPVREDGRVVALCTVTRDMSRIRAAERALRESEQTVRVAVTATGVGLWTWEEGRGLSGDETWQRIHGIGVDRQPRNLEEALQLIHPDDRPSIVAGMRALGKGREVSGEFRVLRPDGTVRWVLSRGVAVRDEDGRLSKVVAGTLDITERREVEERLRQTQKMEALGALAAGVAHNFNNLLMALLPNIEAAAREAPRALADRLEAAREAASRAVRLVRDLTLVAGRRMVEERRDEHPLRLVEEAVAICRSTFPRQIAITVAARGALPTVAVDGSQLLQALLNLCINARDALDGITGRSPALEVTVERLAPGSPDVPEPWRRLEHVRIEVTDNGAGMPEAVQQRAFEPFFTTKDVGKGTGLGLSTTYAIVKNHGGWITCRSVEGKGTTFSLLLPSVTCGRGPEVPVAATPTTAPAGRRILIIDDEAAVRAIVGRILADAGYDVVHAADGAEGLLRYQKEGPFSVVLLDESMPGMPGRLVLERLLAHDPAAKVVMFTGYGPEAESIPGAAGVLEKPVAIDAILAFLRRVVDRPAAAV
jgi:two-component system cell cycle sensor histidine kinase/response regulator CckA